ncbi:MAG: tetratricopeptide repeat protein [Gammaproteobacteria bacterium]|jgi:tetratricopeptide (TPR) repeat protein|nr:tetratricopeptide repeat protein [Gammaproteobacteria bacterium]
MGSRLSILIFLLVIAPLCWGQGADRMNRAQNPTTIIGPRNVPLADGAQALLSGDYKEGVRMTLEGLETAHGRREEEAALSNLCAGYVQLGKYTEALKYCNILLARNDKNWRGFNNRAVIYIMTKQYEKAHDDLLKGEELNPGARTLKVARSMYMDAVYPVRPEVEIDDRKNQDDEEPQK